MHIWVHTCIHLGSLCGPPVRSGAPVAPAVFLPYGIMLGRYFCLLGWLLDMVFIWIGNLFSFESIRGAEKKKRLTEEEESGAIRSPDMKNTGWQWTPGRGGEREEVHHPHYGCLCFKSCTRHQLLTGIYVRNEKPPQQHKQLLSCLFAFGSERFSVDHLPTSIAKGRLIKCHQSEMRVKWRGKSWIFTLIWLTPGGLQSLMAALICIVLCAPHPPFPLTINSFNTFALI